MANRTAPADVLQINLLSCRRSNALYRTELVRLVANETRCELFAAKFPLMWVYASESWTDFSAARTFLFAAPLNNSCRHRTGEYQPLVAGRK
jgi:hypothetical protein